MCEHRRPSSLLLGAWAFVLSLAPLAAPAQEVDPSKIPWEQIEAWAAAPEAPAVTKDPPKDAPKDVAKDHPKEPPDSAKDPKDVAKDPPKDAPKDIAKDPVPAWTPRPGTRRPEPAAYQEMLVQIGRVLTERLKDTPNSQYARQVEIYVMLEQYDKALERLDKMLNEPKRWQPEARSGWISGKLWECALLARVRPPAAWINQQFEDWKVKEPVRIDAYVADGGYGRAYRDRLMKTFQDKQEFYAKDGEKIAEKLRELELKGDADPAALLEIKDRCLAKHPDAPLTGLRALCKLREWYPELPAVKSGALHMALVHQLAAPFLMYREASKEAEALIEKSPACAEVASGGPVYYAGEYAFLHADRLFAPYLGESFSPKDRTRPVYAEAKEYWERARLYFLRLRKEYPKHPMNHADSRDSADSRLGLLARPDRLGPERTAPAR
jgi:hypothetical protein